MKKIWSMLLSVMLLLTFTVTALSPLGAVAQAATRGISAEQAKQIALQHAGLAESDVLFQKIELDREHGRLVYEIEFISNYQEYDYEIDANSGEIVSFDYDIDKQKHRQSPSSQNIISADQAKQIAFEHRGIKENESSFLKVKLDKDDGRLIYEVKFYIGFTEYEYDIDATNGNIIAYEVD